MKRTQDGTLKQVLPGVRTTRRGKRRDCALSKRTKRIYVRLTPEEYEAFGKKARAAGISVSSLLRDHVEHTAVYNHKGQQRWYAVLISLRAHVAALAEKAAEFKPVDAAVMIAYLAAIARHLERLAHQERHYARQILPSRNGQ